MKRVNILKIGGVREFLLDFIGEEGVGIIELLAEKGVVDEFQIADLLDKEVNSVRSLLYKLYSKKIVSYTKERDDEKGWWIYSWQLHLQKILSLFEKRKKKTLKYVEDKLKKKKDAHMYDCHVCLIVFPFSEAMENMFQCPSCGGRLTHKSDKEEIKRLEEQRRELKGKIKELEGIRAG